ncbi:unnamed protein product [Dovyalis caffra]|uniref:Uncharacterized protein n=1 Tax=Dovyalis caffra TaxID=77055 RepID=A0AAV1SVM6_9ROSI|nr:unnamed protein product [Dovyalis caffra]
MANRGNDITYQAGELTGQVQAKKDDLLNQCQEGCNQSTEDSSYTAQASNFIHQAILPITSLFCFLLSHTGEQVKNMAQGAAEAVKNTLGMNTENTPTDNTSSINRPINPSNPSNPSTRI